MRKLLLILLPVILLSMFTACSNHGDHSQQEIPYSEGAFDEWNQIEFPFNETCVPDQETARKICDIIVSNYQEQGYFEHYSAQEIHHDTENSIWIITYWDNSTDAISATFSIAIREKDAQVVQMWVNE